MQVIPRPHSSIILPCLPLLMPFSIYLCDKAIIMRQCLFFSFVLCCFYSHAQQLGPLSVEKIMRDPKWIGTSPSNIFWSHDGQYLYFNWNPDGAPSDSLYYISRDNKIPVKATAAQKQNLLTVNNVSYNNDRTAYVYPKDGDIYFTDTKTGKTKRLMNTTDYESSPRFSFNETKIVYTRTQNLYAWDIATGETLQLTNLMGGLSSTSSRKETLNEQEQWLKNDQLAYFEVLKQRKEKSDKADAYNKSLPKREELRRISIDDKNIRGLSVSPDGRFITYSLYKPSGANRTTIVPSFVTESGFTTEIPARTKVGEQPGSMETFIYDRQRDTIWPIKAKAIPGIRDLPDYLKDYPQQLAKKMKDSSDRGFFVDAIVWSPKGSHAVLDIYSLDNKDRWLMLWDTAAHSMSLLDRQRDEAWIGGPGTSSFNNNTGWADENIFWYQSEATGYSHLYTIDVSSKAKRQLTSGKYEVQSAQLSNDRKTFYIITNEVHPGEKQFYRISVTGSNKERLTSMEGANNAVLSPDEKNIAFLYSAYTKPWELYWQENKPAAKAAQVTNKAMTDEFRSYAWKQPELINFTAKDGATVWARLYKPAVPDPHKPAVIFVHGAGYLQNAHKWWSTYFREYMFHNLLADNGYYVMDIDYRGSAGYGRDWRTGIYRFMGGKDLDDNVDAAGYLVQHFGVDSKRIGIYGGSYGGFITLMALFTKPGTFAAGAALRPVTDWANYNHEYTSNILNEPFTDSLAYRRSSPFYFAGGLQDHLLICHGMVDVNVHFQDAVKLSQRLIELGKDNWEMAAYPMEDHGFVEPSSWTDEYKRIFKLFENVLKK